MLRQIQFSFVVVVVYAGEQQVTASVWLLTAGHDPLFHPLHCELHGTELC